MSWRHFGAAMLAVVLGLTANLSHAENRYTLGTNPQGTIYYSIGGGIAAALQKRIGKPVTVQPFTGSSVYIPLIGAGELTMGLNSSLDLGDWYRGENGKPIKNLRVLARIWPLTVGFAVRNSLGISKVSELKGKRVVTQFSALKGMSQFNQVLLQLSGLGLNEVTPITTAGLGPGMAGLTEGTLDATSIAIGIPLTQQAHATIPGGIRYLEIDGEKATSEEADKLYPGLYLTQIKPTARLPEVTEPVTVGGFDVFLTVSADLPDSDATALLEALYDSLPQLKADYPPLGGAAQDKLALPSNTVPYHPAAVAFFKKKGLWTQVNAARDAALLK